MSGRGGGYSGQQPNMQQLMKQAQKMQAQLAAAQAELAEVEVTGSAGGGLVTATVSGAGELKALTIDPGAIDVDDVETLQDLVVAAVRDANRAASASWRRRRWARCPVEQAWVSQACEHDHVMYEGAVQDLIDELGRLPGVGPQERAADRVPPARRRTRRRRAPCGNPATGQGRGPVLPHLRQRHRVRGVPDLPRSAPRPDHHLRGRGAQGRPRGRAHPRVPRPLPRARRGDQPDRRASARTTCASASCWRGCATARSPS